MRTNRSVERAIALMMFLCRDGKPMGLTQISQGVGLDKATTLRILNTLANSDLVRQESDTKHYVPGAGIYNFWPSEMRKICRPYLQSLMENMQETICLIALRGKQRVCIEVIEPDRELKIVAAIGRALPVFLGSSGRVFMASKSESQVRSLLGDEELKLFIDRDDIDSEAYIRDLESVRLAGYSYMGGEVESDLASIAVPIYDGLGNIAAAVVVRGPITRLTKTTSKSMAIKVKATARAISTELISTLN